MQNQASRKTEGKQRKTEPSVKLVKVNERKKRSSFLFDVVYYSFFFSLKAPQHHLSLPFWMIFKIFKKNLQRKEERERGAADNEREREREEACVSVVMTGRKRGRPPKEAEVTLETAPTKVTKLSSVPENNRGSPSPPPLENGSAEEEPGALQSVSPQTTPAYQQREEEREEERDPLVTSPPERDLVIYCGNCNTILGDTSTFICTHAKAKTLTLGGTSSYHMSLALCFQTNCFLILLLPLLSFPFTSGATMVTVKRGEEVEIEKSGFMLGW